MPSAAQLPWQRLQGNKHTHETVHANILRHENEPCLTQGGHTCAVPGHEPTAQHGVEDALCACSIRRHLNMRQQRLQASNCWQGHATVLAYANVRHSLAHWVLN